MQFTVTRSPLKPTGPLDSRGIRRTRLFPGNTPPAHFGPYEVRFDGSKEFVERHFTHSGWAFPDGRSSEFGKASDAWRGLRQNPNIAR